MAYASGGAARRHTSARVTLTTTEKVSAIRNTLAHNCWATLTAAERIKLLVISRVRRTVDVLVESMLKATCHVVSTKEESTNLKSIAANL